MSFPKAKIHRFNEETSCAPPPGTYDPKIETKVKGVVMASAKRFPEQMCVSSSLDSLDKVGTLPQVNFRTPQLIRKVIQLTPRLKHLQDNKFDTPGSTSSASSTKSEEKPFNLPKKAVSLADFERLEHELSALADQHLNEVVERDLEITALKEKLESVDSKNKDLKIAIQENKKLAAERSKELLEVRSNLDLFVQRINKERQDHQTLNRELEEKVVELQTVKEDLEGVIAEEQRAVVRLNDKYLALEIELNTLRQEKEKYHQTIVQIEETNSEILDRVLVETGKDIDQLEENLQCKVRSLENKFDSAQHSAQVDFQSKLNMVSHEFTMKSQEMERKMNCCFSKIKELETILDQKANEFMKDLEEADENCKQMYRELCRVEQERDDLLAADLEEKLVLHEKCTSFEQELDDCRVKCKQYEVTLKTMQSTVNALSRRLHESETEVERLNKVEGDLENQKVILEEKSQLLLADITALREGMEKMEKDIIADVSTLKEHLAAKVEHFKNEAAKQVDKLNCTINEKQCALDMMLKENEYYRRECNRKEDHIVDLQHKVKKYKEDLVEFRRCSLKKEEELHERFSAQKNVCTILNEKLEEKNCLLKELQVLKTSQENQISLFLDKIRHNEIAEVNSKQEIALLKEQIATLQDNLDNVEKFLFISEEKTKEKNEEVEKLSHQVESLQRNLKNAEEKISVLDDAKLTLENQLIESDINASEEKMAFSKEIEKLLQEKNELQLLLHSAKEKMKSELPKLERDNINKAELILEQSLSIDSLKEEFRSKVKCLEAEKASLTLLLEDAKENVSYLENKSLENEVVISKLKNALRIAEENHEGNKAQIQKVNELLQKDSEERKRNLENAIKLSEAEDKINELQAKLSATELKLQAVLTNEELELEKSSRSSGNEVIQLKEILEDMSMRMSVVTEERDRLNEEMAELLGHQNIHQKIRHINQLKQHKIELQQKNEDLLIENNRLKKKIAELQGKENAHPHAATPKTAQLKAPKLTSPGVLRARNQ